MGGLDEGLVGYWGWGLGSSCFLKWFFLVLFSGLFGCYLNKGRLWFLVLTPSWSSFLASPWVFGFRFSLDLIRFIIVNNALINKIDLQLSFIVCLKGLNCIANSISQC